MTKTIQSCTRKDFLALPLRQWSEDVGIFTSLVILPTRRIHDSNYRCMDFVAVRNGIPFCRLSGGSDVLNIEGIGGYGKDGTFSSMVPASGWSIDCLRTSGLLHIFCSSKSLKAGPALSSFEIYSTED